MTVSSQISSITHECDGISTAFAVPFYFLLATDLVVSLVDPNPDVDPVTLLLGTQYSVSGAGSPPGGVVTTMAAYASGYRITIERLVPVTQEVAYQANDPFPAKTHERALDKLTMIAQQLWRLVGGGSPLLSRFLMLGPRDISGAGAYRANNNRIRDLGDPIADQDAVNRRTAVELDNGVRDYAEQLVAGVAPGAGTGSFQQFGIGAIVRTFQDKMRDSVNMADFAVSPGDVALALALNTLRRVGVAATAGVIEVSMAQSATILPRLSMLDAEGPLDLAFDAGIHEITSSNPIATIGQNQAVRLVGATPITGTLQGVLGVSGGTGEYYVQYQLSTDQAQVGQVLRIGDMPGGAAYFQASPVRRPYDGELAVGNARMGAITTSGATCTVSIGNVPTNLVVGDLVHIEGQTRRVQSIVNATSFTVDAAFDLNVAGYQWWYYTVPAVGTISTSGRSASVAGAGTAFSSAANAGDFIFADGVGIEILSIANDGALTLVAPQTFPPGTPYTIVRGSVMHEGSFEITAVDGFNVTVRNRSQYRPPVAGVVPGAAVNVIRTVFKQRGTGNGFVFERGAVLREMTNIALVGPGNSTASTGLAMNGAGSAYNQGSSVMVLGDNAAVLEWGYGAHMSTGCVLFGWKAHICNNLNAGMEAIDGAAWYLRGAVVSHNRDIGILGSGGYGRYSEARICGNRLQGIRQDVGSAMYGDSPVFWGNGNHHILGVNRSGIQCNDGLMFKAGGNGVNMQNGAGGRFSRMLIAGSAQHNIFVDGCHDVEATQAWVTGARAGQSGVVCSHGSIKFGNGAATGNAAAGLYAPEGGRIYAQGGHTTKNGTNGARSDSQALIQLTGGRVAGNVGADISRQGGAVTTDANPYGTWQQGATYSQLVTIADDAVFSVDLGDATVGVIYLSGSATSLTGMVRARAGSGGGSISQTSGGGVTLLQNTILTGTTGADGDVTMSVSTNGNFYIENRAGAPRVVTLQIIGAVNK